MQTPDEVPLPDGVMPSSVARVLRGAGATFAFFHGSRVEGRHRPDSDLDVAAWFGRDIASWDIAMPPRTDLLVLDSAGLELAGRVAQRGVLLFDDDPPVRVAWQADRSKRYLDEAHRRWGAVVTVLSSVVDPVRLTRLLQRLGEQLSHLRERAAEDRTLLRDDDVRLSATKYRFIMAIEAVLDISHHVLASELWGPADASADAVRLLARHGVIDDDLAVRLVRAVGFRNVLVHGYADVDDDLVLANLDQLDDLQAFIDQVTAWARDA